MIWYDFIDAGHQYISTIGKIQLASYTYVDAELVVWPNRVDDPDAPIMFIATHIGRCVVPGVNFKGMAKSIVTDGEKWCPLIEGNADKYRSYPLVYSGVMLTKRDQAVIKRYLQEYTKSFKD